MVAQTAGRADHDMGARGQLALFGARVHAADAGNHPRIGILIEPGELALHLQGQLAGGRHDQGKRCGGALELLGIAEQVFCDGESIGDGLARAGLRRHQQVAAGRGVRRYGGLHRGGGSVVALGEGPGERRTGG